MEQKYLFIASAIFCLLPVTPSSGVLRLLMLVDLDHLIQDLVVDDLPGFFRITLMQGNFFREILFLWFIVEFVHFLSNMSVRAEE